MSVDNGSGYCTRTPANNTASDFSHPLCPGTRCVCACSVPACGRGQARPGVGPFGPPHQAAPRSMAPWWHWMLEPLVCNLGGGMQRPGMRAGMNTSSAAHRRSSSRDSASVAEEVDRVVEVVAVGSPLVEGVGHLRLWVRPALVDPIAVVRVPLPDALVVVAAQVTHHADGHTHTHRERERERERDKNMVVEGA